MKLPSFINLHKRSTDSSVADCLAQVRLGPPQTYRDIAIWPLFLSEESGADYRTLDEMVESGQALVTETSNGGSVPELKVVNLSGDPLLILDGEELLGAKQNRVVNATMLLRPKSETVIPVSCSEQGRWHHVSKAFKSSDVVMEMKTRRLKMESVSDALKAGMGHSSDQAAVWSSIEALHAKAHYKSPTKALHDLFTQQAEGLTAALAAFPALPGQQGLLVSIRGRVAGCDLLSRAKAYHRLHGKLLRSYLLDVLLEESLEATVNEADARDFLAEAMKCKEERFPSVGWGHSIRLRNGRIAGAALSHQGVIIHVALFRSDPQEGASEIRRMASFAERRRRSGVDNGSQT